MSFEAFDFIEVFRDRAEYKKLPLLVPLAARTLPARIGETGICLTTNGDSRSELVLLGDLWVNLPPERSASTIDELELEVLESFVNFGLDSSLLVASLMPDSLSRVAESRSFCSFDC